MGGHDFLQLLFPVLDAAHRIELRVIKRRRLVRRAFCADIDEALIAVGADLARHDVFFGVAARGPGDDGTRSSLAYTTALWADVDAKCYADKAGALEVIRCTDPLASAIIDSGHGYHAYWLLDASFHLDGDRAAAARIEGVMRGLRERLRLPAGRPLDPCDDAPHLMRLPGTLNHKSSPLRLVRVVELHADRRYRLDDLARLHVPAAVATCAFAFGGDERDGEEALARGTARGLSARMRDLIVTGGIGPYPSRSERDQAVVVALLALRTDPDDVRAIFADLPVGDRYREAGSGDRYLAACIGTARAYLDSQQGRQIFGALPAEVTERVAVQRACRELGRISGALPATRRELERRLRRSRATLEKYLGWGVRLGWYRQAQPDVTGPGRPAARYELVDGVRPRVCSGPAFARDAEAVAALRDGSLKERAAGGVRL